MPFTDLNLIEHISWNTYRIGPSSFAETTFFFAFFIKKKCHATSQGNSPTNSTRKEQRREGYKTRTFFLHLRFFSSSSLMHCPLIKVRFVFPVLLVFTLCVCHKVCCSQALFIGFNFRFFWQSLSILFICYFFLSKYFFSNKKYRIRTNFPPSLKALQ